MKSLPQTKHLIDSKPPFWNNYPPREWILDFIAPTTNTVIVRRMGEAQWLIARKEMLNYLHAIESVEKAIAKKSTPALLAMLQNLVAMLSQDTNYNEIKELEPRQRRKLLKLNSPLLDSHFKEIDEQVKRAYGEWECPICRQKPRYFTTYKYHVSEKIEKKRKHGAHPASSSSHSHHEEGGEEGEHPHDESSKSVEEKSPEERQKRHHSPKRSPKRSKKRGKKHGESSKSQESSSEKEDQISMLRSAEGTPPFASSSVRKNASEQYDFYDGCIGNEIGNFSFISRLFQCPFPIFPNSTNILFLLRVLLFLFLFFKVVIAFPTLVYCCCLIKYKML